MDNLQSIANADVSAGMSVANVHDRYKPLSVDQRATICKEQAFPYEVMIVNITGELNVGNILRTSSLCGAQRVYIVGRRKYDKRGAVGAEHYIDLRRIPLMIDELTIDIDAVADFIDYRRLYPVFIEQDRDAYPYCREMFTNIDGWARGMNRIPCFIFGNEGRGIPSDLIDRFRDKNGVVMQLRQQGVIRSFNVGSTAAIVLYGAMEHYR